jgi:hypothetical protein
MTLPTPLNRTEPVPPSVMARLADIPEEEIWLAKQKSARTRRAYRLDVRHFMATLGIISSDELRHDGRRARVKLHFRCSPSRAGSKNRESTPREFIILVSTI